MIAAVVLAAGTSSRFGAPKVLAPLSGVPLVRHVVERLRRTVIDAIVVVAGDAAVEIGGALHGTRAVLARNTNPRAGLSESLRVGLQAVPADAEAILIALGDQPLIDPAVVNQLVVAWRAGRGTIIVPEYRGERGNPVLFDASLRADLMQIEGDQGARSLLDARSAGVFRLLTDEAVPRDVDTTDDLRAIASGLAGPSGGE